MVCIAPYIRKPHHIVLRKHLQLIRSSVHFQQNQKQEEAEAEADKQRTKSNVEPTHPIKWSNSDILNRLYRIAEPERKLIYASAATLGITSSITLILPYACGEVLDMAMMEATGHSSSSGTFSPFLVATGLFGLTGVAGLGVYARSLMLNIAGNRIVSRMRRQLFRSIIAQEAAFFDCTKSGELISRLSNDCYFIKSAVTTEAVSGLRGIIMSLGSTSLLFYTSPKLALVSLCSIPPVFLAARMVGRALKEEQNIVQELHGKAMNVAEEVFTGHKTVQLFATERNEVERYSHAINHAHEKEINVGKTRAAFDGMVHVAANGAVLVVLGYGGSLVLANEMSAGELTGFLMYSLLMAGNISSLSGTYTEMMKSIAAAGRTFDIIDRIPSIPSSFQSNHHHHHHDHRHHPVSPSQRTLEHHKGPISVKFQDVSFSYPTRKDAIVLGPKFNLDIAAGEHIAIVGGSGSGKSTAGSLLCRLYDVDRGNIFLNEIRIMDLDPSFLRSQVGVVSQEPMLFAGTIKENIKYGKLSATEEEVLHAARAAHVLNFTDQLPYGLETQVGHGGSSQLSGGQKQRVAIARILLKDPPIVILDEATSALDAKSEYHINEAIKSMSRGRTVISIAHRMSTIKDADRIAVLKDGEVVETGTFQELIQAGGAFCNLMEQQLTMN
jgi:ABC-type multidrug transport system fused ATPase/permease subunit